MDSWEYSGATNACWVRTEQCKEKHRGHRGTCGPWQLGDGGDDDEEDNDDEAEVKCDPPPDRPRPCHMYDYKWRFPLHVYQE